MDLDAFLRDENIRRYRRLLDSSLARAERETILKLLAEEMKMMKEQHRPKAAEQRLCERDRRCVAVSSPSLDYAVLATVPDTDVTVVAIAMVFACIVVSSSG